MQSTNGAWWRPVRLIRFRTILFLSLSLLFAASIVGKARNPWPTVDVLSGVWGFPRPAAEVGTLLLIAVEGVLVVSLAARGVTRGLALVAAVFLLAVTASPVRQLIGGGGAGCGCGLGPTHLQGGGGVVLAIARNVGLVTACGVYAAFWRRELRVNVNDHALED